MNQRLPKQFVERGILLILLLYSVFPIYIVINASLKERAELFLNPLGLPSKICWENYPKTFALGRFEQAFRNSGILSLGTVLGILSTATPAAFALAKIKFLGSTLLMGYLFFCTTLPPYLFLIPLFHIFARIGFLNSLPGLIIIYIAIFSPFTILLLRSYFVKIPNELIEAALVDGASKWQAFWKVVFPVAKPGIITSAIIVAMRTWNDFLLALTFLHKEELHTASLALFMFQGRWRVAWEMIMVASVLNALPIVVLFTLAHRRFIAGLASTGLKE